MKHQNNFFTRIYLVEVLNAYFAQEKNRYQPIDKKILYTININDLFEEIMEFPMANLNRDLEINILNTYLEKELFINSIREKYQDRNSKGVDYILIIILNTAIAEYLSHNISINIIISEYVNICSLFHDATKFVHSILDKSLNSLKESSV